MLLEASGHGKRCRYNSRKVTVNQVCRKLTHINNVQGEICKYAHDIYIQRKLRFRHVG